MDFPVVVVVVAVAFSMEEMVGPRLFLGGDCWELCW